MKLAHLTLASFAGAPDGTYSFLHPATGKPHAVALVTGRPASGKTSLLRAVAALKETVGGYGPPPDLARLRRRGATEGRVSATWILTPDEAAAAGTGTSLVTEVALDDGPSPLFDPGVRALFSAFSPDPARAKFELFPAHRRLGLARLGPGAPPSDLAEPRLRLSEDPRKYAGVRGALVELAIAGAGRAAARLSDRGLVARWEQPDALAGVKRGVAALAPWLRLVGVDLGARSGPEVCFLRRDGAELTLADLSEQEQDAVLFAAMFDLLGLAHAILLVDRPELFVAAEDQLRFFGALATLGADAQIIAATTSEPILAAVEPSAVVRLDGRATAA